MTTKSTKNKPSGKQNRPFQQSNQESSKLQTKLNPNTLGQTQKITKGIQSQKTSSTIPSNLSLNILSNSNIKNSNQTETTQPWNQTSITQIQEQQPIKKELRERQKRGQIEKKDDYEQLQLASSFIRGWQETVESEKNWKQEKELQGSNQEKEQNIKHYVLPDTMFQGQFTYVTKEKKEEDVEEQLQELQQQKRQLQISTEHYIIPSTVVQGQVERASKQLKKQEVQKEVKKVEELKESEQKPQSPKVVPRVNLHEFQSYQLPQLHQHDIPLQHKVDQLSVNLHEEIQNPTITPIKPLEPVPVSLKTDNQQQKLNPLYIDVPKNEDLPPQYQHYIIPGTMFQGQFTYVTKEKKQEDVEQQLRQLQEQKRQLQISTEHYIIPSTVVEGQSPNINKELKKQQVEQELKRTEQQKKHAFQKKKNYLRGSQPNIRVKDLETKSQLSRMSSFQIQSMRLQKKKDPAEGSLKFQITSKEEKSPPVKIDQQSAMTMITSHREERSIFTLPRGQEANYDLQFLVIDANLNNESQSPKDTLQARPTSLLTTNRVPDILNQLKTKEGSPLKVIIGTKQFANFPNQSSLSPPIIDELTLRKLRKQNQEQMKKTGQTVFPPPKVFVSRSSDQSFTFQKRIIIPRGQVDRVFIAQDLQQQPIFIEDLQDRKRKNKPNKNQDEEPSLMIKLVRSLAISTLVGGFTWIGFKDSKITAASAAAGLAIALIAQK